MLRYALLLCVGASLCAAARIPKILGGKNADPTAYKYHVAILELLEDGSTRHVCSGAIIDRRFVLTAAHCVYERNSPELVVRAGGNLPPPEGKPHHEKRVFRQVAKIMYPKDYIKDARYHEYDVAVLKIKGTFDLVDQENFKKVYLPVIDDDFEDKSSVVSGYGVHDANQKAPKVEGDGFKSLKTKVISNDECQSTRTFILTRGSLCTLSIQEKGHTCNGDGGDPLVYDNQLIGILNAPSTCDSQRPELFTRVSTYVPLIKKILGGQVLSDIEYR
ncbi:chymotrypsin-2-like [Nasonia vitripennis]|uniref:Peptidase S1 domain-containing protein n=1 Tax=Nasonia vitripennis TaxID=7425 RepID=A0A7M7J139_NASVI|nr:chymotrypsin-2-like [Nasonia vitripennis]